TTSLAVTVAASDSTVRGLSINGFDAGGIALSNTSNVVVQGNFIGLDAQGTITQPLSGTGIDVDQAGIGTSTNNTIGGPTPAARNVITSYATAQIRLSNLVTGTVIAGNYIGTDPSGTLGFSGPPLPARSGILMIGGPGASPSNNTIGGTTAGAGNLI